MTAVVPPVTQDTCWDYDLFVHAGYTPANEVFADFGTARTYEAVVVHTMEGYLQGAVDTWNHGNASAHLCILRDGTVVRTVRLEDVAWHAGTDAKTGRDIYWKSHNVNPHSIGIEHEGYAASGVTQAQVDACIRVGTWLKARYGIPAVHTIDTIPGWHRHSELSNQRSDPGALFPLDAIVAAVKARQ